LWDCLDRTFCFLHALNVHTAASWAQTYSETASCHMGDSRISFLPQWNRLGEPVTSADLQVDPKLHGLKCWCCFRLRPGYPVALYHCEKESLVGTDLLLGMRQRDIDGAGFQWLTPVLGTTQEAEIRRITVQASPEK
jgi:hypothetical protein